MITQPNWQPLAANVEVPAKPAALWTRAVDYVTGPRKLKIVAQKGNWKLSAAVSCGADGDIAASIETSSPAPLFPAALHGALIGKIGGSAADNTVPTGADGSTTHPATVPTPFSVGSFCIIEIAADKRGALFLTMNDGPSGFGDHDEKLVVDIYHAI